MGAFHQLFVISGSVDAANPANNATHCDIVQPDFLSEVARGNVSLRTVTPVFGLGLVEQIPETTILSNIAADASRKAALGISGRVNRGPNDDRIGRFGWKSQNVSLQLFSAEALAVEQGQTNMTFPNDSDETPGCHFAPSPNLPVTQSVDFTESATLFMKFLAPSLPHASVPGGADSIARGRTAFATVGCATCHTPTMRSRAETDFPVLANKDVNLYSDLALHNMGPGLADDIAQGLAKGDEFRTAPLWGVGTRLFFLHDGRTNNLIEAIRAHRSAGNATYGPSEANAVIGNYDALSAAQQQDLLN
ncbi:MAG TPA: di-heme oxidoredictase family protein, partial [Nitrospiraceae bacterium]|nr:di-heme oxidoredictase family protein [Nitrospiraceae bacterium]